MAQQEIQRWVLVVEDDQYVRDIFERVFVRHPEFLLDPSASIEDAIHKIHVCSYDIIFLDMHFGGDKYEGMRVLRELNRLVIEARGRGQSVINSRVIIMSSTVSLQQIMPEAHALGVISFMDKPIPFDERFLMHILQCIGMPMLPPQRPDPTEPTLPPALPLPL